ncbi:MAG: penicillin-binding protein 2 [Pseudomonadota bacterium]
MKRSPEDNVVSVRRISRRALIVGAVQLGIVGGLAARMRYLQIDQAEKYRLLAEDNRIKEDLLAQARGMIFDRNGRPVAANTPNYRVLIKLEEVDNVDDVIASLQKLIFLKPSDLAKAYEQFDRRRARRETFVPVSVAENLTWEEFSKVAVNAPVLPGVETEVGLSRVYPQKENLAHVVGYVGPVSDFDLNRIENPPPLLLIPRFQLGKVQLESKMEPVLRGSAGRVELEVNAAGRVIRELGRIEGDAGKDITISIDSKLQNYILARMDGHSASAVVLDVTNGDVLAIGSTPTFDPNLFVRGISTRNYNALRDDKFGPLRAKAVQGTYPPGSTFKMIVALAALEAGVVDPGERVRCTGNVTVSNNVFNCWKSWGHGRMDMLQSIMQSCDVYYYTICQRVGIDRISEMAQRFGLGVRHDVPLSAVREGNMPNRDWKQRVHDEPWLIGDTVNASIGQGFLLSSPLQLAVMAARLGTGRSVTPRLVRRIEGVEQPTGAGDPIDVAPANLKLIQETMYGVCNVPGGTAYRRRLEPRSLAMAGKTGTSQVRRISAAEREAGVIRNEDLPWERRDHALFVNYAPYDDPKIAVAVVVEHGGSGGATAAPIARDITGFALTGDIPDPSVYPSEIRSDIAQEQVLIREKLKSFDDIDPSGSDQV